MIIIIKHLTNSIDDAPLLISPMQKIHQEISLTHQNPGTVRKQNNTILAILREYFRIN